MNKTEIVPEVVPGSLAIGYHRHVDDRDGRDNLASITTCCQQHELDLAVIFHDLMSTTRGIEATMRSAAGMTGLRYLVTPDLYQLNRGQRTLNERILGILATHQVALITTRPETTLFTVRRQS